MAKDIVLNETTKLPAHLANLGGVPAAGDWTSGTTGGFPVISIKGKVFNIKRGSESEMVMNPADPDAPAQSLHLIVLKTHPGVAKTYYEGAYVEGSDDKPTCYSADGIAPAPDAEDRQAKKCAICPHNQWGSRITEDGKQAKECSDVKRLAVAASDQINDPMLVRIPPTSLKAWDNYVSMLAKRGLTPAHVITKISFDPEVAHQSILFKTSNFITAEMVPQIEEMLRDPLLDKITGISGHTALPHDGDAPEPTAPPAPAASKPPAADKKKRTKPAETPPPPPVEEPDEEADAIAAAEAALAAAKKRAAAKKAGTPEPVAAAPAEESEDEDGGEFADIDFTDLDFGEGDDD